MTGAMFPFPPQRPRESGNVFFFVLLAVALIGLVTAALRSGGDGANIDRETMMITASQVRQYASELERGIAFIMQDGASETEIRFANELNTDYGDITDTPRRQVFDERGGGVNYRLPPADVSTATQWEFYGFTHLPEVGTGAPELIAVLPEVSEDFCAIINQQNSYDPATQPMDSGTCLNDTGLRFTSGTFTYGSLDTGFAQGVDINSTDEASFTVKPSMQGCVQCGTDYHFFHVLMAR